VASVVGLAPFGVAEVAAAGAPGPAIVSLTLKPLLPHVCRPVQRAGATTYVCPDFGEAMVVTVAVRDARRCTFLRQATPSSAPSPFRMVSCSSGRARVTVPAIRNTSTSPVRLIYAVRAVGAGNRFAQRGVRITEVGARPEPTPPEPPPLPLAPPPVTPVVPTASPPDVVEQTNWSGYSVLGGPFTAVTGTFNVPDLHPTPALAFTSEWVGIDGAVNDSLIQAGVDEIYDPATRSTAREAWWEIIPAAATPIAMSVATGDQITVTIGQVSGTLWQISLTDDTSGRSFVLDQTYHGPGASAEWIVEAPSAEDGAPYPLGNYDPAVTFRDLRINGAESALSESIMIQDDATVSTPSPLTPAGFAVAHGDAPPPAP
jgi:hypothetical protein